MAAPGDLEALMAEAQAEYASRLPEKLAELRAHVAAALWIDAERAAHKLRGSAGVYGFSAIGEAAAALEELLEASGDEAPPAPALDGAMSALASAMAAARKDAP